ncbi:MAG: protein kinase [Pirellulales bacterium]|nr:protein kinase [Pirellulales bacterium]
MPAADELRILARAYANELVSVAQISDLLRELGKDDSASLSLLLESLGLLSQEQIAALVESSRLESRRSGGSQAPSLPVSELGARTTRGMARSSTVHSDPTADTQEFTPQPAGARAASDWPTVPNDDAPAIAKTATSDVEARQRYVLMSELGRGGLGRVRLAFDEQLGREVAVKDLLPQSLHAADKIRRFIEEARVTGQLEHPGVVPVYATGLDAEGNPFYAMKRIGGRTLSQAIREFHRLDHGNPTRPQHFSELLTVFVSICRTMAFAHRRGVLHRDLKPQNIIVGEFGEAIVVDWGLAKHFVSPTDTTLHAEVGEVSANGNGLLSDDANPNVDAAHTRAGTIVGTIPYMSPEQALAQPLDARSDIYALGAILFDMLTGSAPFRGERREVLRRVQRGQVPNPRSVAPQVPRALAAVCLKAMARQADDRYQSALELADEVVRFQAGEPVLAYREPWYDRSLRWIKRHRTVVLTAAVGAAVFAILIGAWTWQERRRIEGIATQAAQLVREAHDAQAREDLDTAVARFDQANLILAREPRLKIQLVEVDRDREQVAKQRQHVRALADAARVRVELRQAVDEAQFRAMLAARDRAQNRDEANTDELSSSDDFALAKAAVERGLAGDLALSMSSPGAAALLELLMPDERAEVATNARELRLIAAELASIDPTAESDQARAQQALASLSKVAADPPLQALYARRSKYFELAGEPQQAAEARRLAEAIQPSEALDFFLLGDERLAAEDYAAAAESFAEALRLKPERFWAQYFLAATQLQLGQPRDALANLTACISRRPDFAWCYLLRGLARGEIGELKKAEADYARAIELLGPAAPRQDLYALHLNRGITRLSANKFGEAIDDFEAARPFDRTRVEALVNQAEAWRRVARQFGVLAPAAVPGSVVALDLLASSNKRALDLLDQATTLAPRDPQPLVARGRLRREQGDLRAASTDFQRALALARPGTRQRAQVLAELGRVQHMQKQYDAALTSYRAALTERGDFAEAWYLQALLLVDMARPAEALVAFDRFLRGGAQPRPGAAPLSAAEVVARLAQNLSATAVASDEPDAVVRLAAFLRERGLARLLMKDYEGGMTDAEVASELMKSRSGGLTRADRERFALLETRRGWSYLLSQTLAAERAIKAFDRAIAEGSPHGDPLTGRATARLVLGQYREAIADVAQAVEIGPPVTGLLYNAASVYAAARPLVERDPAASDATAQSAAWLAECIKLLRRAFEQADGPTRAAFWTELDRDAAFDSIRGTAELEQLRDQFDPRAAAR